MDVIEVSTVQVVHGDDGASDQVLAGGVETLLSGLRAGGQALH